MEDSNAFQLLPSEKQFLDLHQLSPNIVQNANFGVLVIDEGSRIRRFNKTASELLAIPEEIIGKTLEEAMWKMPKQSLELLFQAFSGQNLANVEIEVLGEKKILEITSNSLLSENGKKEGMVLLFYETTAKQKDPTPIEDNIQLAAVSRLAAEVAHELKNPITVIKGFSQLLLKKNYDDAQVEDFLKIISAEAEHANLFIQDFLNLGKPNTPRMETINVPRLITEVIAQIESQCFLNEIEIIQQLNCSSKIYGDPDQLKHALVNLAKNSIEAMEESDPPKTLSFILSKGAQNQIVISIKDSGCGIPPYLLKKIMTPFFTTKKYGTGLGLNISKKIIQQNGGTLYFSSCPSETVATIEFLCKQEPR